MDVRFPAHERGTLFDAPPVEPLLAPPDRSLENIVSAFLRPPLQTDRSPAGKLQSKIPVNSSRKCGVDGGRSSVERNRKVVHGSSEQECIERKSSGAKFASCGFVMEQSWRAETCIASVKNLELSDFLRGPLVAFMIRL